MNPYTLAVGSTATHYAHEDSWKITSVLADYHFAASAGWGEWAGTREDTTLYHVELPDDATALRVATGIAMLTDNACVLVSRATTDSDDSPMGSLRKFRVRAHATDTGDRTITDLATGTGYRYVPDITGDSVAYLAWRNGTVTTV